MVNGDLFTNLLQFGPVRAILHHYTVLSICVPNYIRSPSFLTGLPYNEGHNIIVNAIEYCFVTESVLHFAAESVFHFVFLH